MIPTLPLAPRNRLAGLILAALHDAGARSELARLAAAGGAAGLAGWLAPGEEAWAERLTARARSACAALDRLPLAPPAVSLEAALDAAAALWQGRLYFEVHELLEPHWRAASGAAREALQGLVQVAVGYQHLANGNLAGARALLEEGSARLHGRALAGRAFDAFARRAAASAAGLPSFDWTAVPALPGAGPD
ncbi:MAG: DUF309 domain-containing protein [Candidatus Rokubacteria bacterium]|nr:DUF309 domain-containing protein [Candidatus Rokubacteria bacterium]